MESVESHLAASGPEPCRQAGPREGGRLSQAFSAWKELVLDGMCVRHAGWRHESQPNDDKDRAMSIALTMEKRDLQLWNYPPARAAAIPERKAFVLTGACRLSSPLWLNAAGSGVSTFTPLPRVGDLPPAQPFQLPAPSTLPVISHCGWSGPQVLCSPAAISSLTVQRRPEKV